MNNVVRVASISVGLIFAAFCGCTDADSPVDSTPQASEVETLRIREQLGKLKYQRDKTNRTLVRLEQYRSDVLTRLREQGVTSVDDLKRVPDWRIHAEELRSMTNDIRRFTATRTKLDDAILRLESAVRRMDTEMRTQQAALSEDELNELAHIYHETSERLDSPASDSGSDELELEILLEQELQR